MRVFQSTLVLIIAWPFSAAVANDDTLLRLEFQTFSSMTDQIPNKLSPDDPLNQMKVFLDVDTVQPDETQGLAFAIEIINESDQTIIMTDPSEGSCITLFDDKHRECSLPILVERTHSSCYRDTDPEAKQARLNAQRARLDAERAFVIDRPEAITFLNTTKTIHDVNIESGRVTLQPGERLWLPLRIMEVRAHRITKEQRIRRYHEAVEGGITTAQAPPRSVERAPISAGLYTLGASTVVTSWRDNPLRFSSKSVIITSVPTPIRLGEPAAE